MHKYFSRWFVCLTILVLLLPSLAVQAYPTRNTPPSESLNTPNAVRTAELEQLWENRMLPDLIPQHRLLVDQRQLLEGKVIKIEKRVNNPSTAEQIAQTQALATSFNCASVNEVPISECEALVALYTSTNGAGWTNSTNWLSTNSVSNWFGITVTGGYVTSLSLASNNLIGSMPTVLGNLTNLLYINLYSNQLSGTIPSELGKLTKLKYLYLFSNQLSGSIPPELCNLSNLVDLFLSENQLSGNIPPALGNLTKLQNLFLCSNQLSGSIPPELGRLSNLQFLALSSNPLSGSIPPELGSLNSLGLLELDSNHLNGSIPPELGNLSNLWYLGLRDNQLIGSIPLTFTKLNNLDAFDYRDTGVCEPNDAMFQAWKSTVDSWAGNGYRCELSVFLSLIFR